MNGMERRMVKGKIERAGRNLFLKGVGLGGTLVAGVALVVGATCNLRDYNGSIEAQRNSESVLVEEGKDSSFGEAGGQLPMPDWERESLEWRARQLLKSAESEKKFNESMKRYDETMARLNRGYEEVFTRLKRVNSIYDEVDGDLDKVRGTLQSVGDDIERFVDKYIEIPGGTDEN